MEARLEHDFMRQVWRVWLLDRGGRGGTLRCLQVDDGDLTGRASRWVEPGEGVAAPIAPTFEIREDHLKALVEAASEIAPPDRAQGRHLEDAVKVRDRLLALIERDRSPS